MDRGIITISENGTVIMPTAPVWMTQQEMCDAFNVFGCDIRKAPCHLQEYGTVGKRDDALCQAERQDLL